MIHFLLATSLLAVWENPSDPKCLQNIELKDENGAVTATVQYDLTRFHGKDMAHLKPNVNTNQLGNYHWYFQICKDTETIPHEECCNPPNNHCEECVDQQEGFLHGDANTKTLMAGPAPAWQVEINENSTCTRCHRLGRSYTNTKGSAPHERGYMEWGLLSDDNPALGVYVQYNEGDTSPGCRDNNRQFRILFECTPESLAENYNELDLEAAVVDENPMCTYSVKFKSAAGCPAQCPLANNGDGKYRICSGNGHCEIDGGLRQPRCFCNTGWSGPSCAVATNEDVAMSTETCYPLPGGGYVKGICNSGRDYLATKYSDSGCTIANGNEQRFLTDTCTNVFGLTVGIECIVENGPGIFRESYCEVLADEVSKKSGMSTALAVFFVILGILLFGAVIFLVYRQLKSPDMSKFLVLSDEHDNRL